MRFPVFARRANPSVDPPIVRKKSGYCEEQVAMGRADWIDPEDHRKGIVCREMLYFGAKAPEPSERSVTYEGAGLKFIPPLYWKNPTLPRILIPPLEMSVRLWDRATA